MSKPDSITIDDVKFVRADSVEVKPTGNRCVVVIDRGWIMAGDLTEQDGRILLSRAVHVFNWAEIGFDGMLANPKSPKVKLKKMPTAVDFPEGAEIFRCPVEQNWGL